MTIAWTYLDKRGAAVDALKDFASMEYIIANHAEDEEAIREDMTAVSAPALGGQPSGHNPHAGEARLAAQLDEIDVLKERYRQALEYMEWFRPAWNEMTEDERFILREFFLREDIAKTEAILNIGERLHIERTWVYKKKDATLTRLALLLYGK
jgi:hypothetical protein